MGSILNFENECDQGDFEVDLGVFIGRFEPLHDEHENHIRRGLQRAKRVVVLPGSANCPSDTRNPFPFEIRKRMIISAFRKEYREGRIIIAPLNDHTYHNGAWHKEVTDRVDTIAEELCINNPRIGLFGFMKDETSSYLTWFPNWTSLVLHEQTNTINASDIRQAYLRDGAIMEEHLSPGVVRIMKRWKRTAAYRRVVREYAEIGLVNRLFGKGPFRTSDAIIEHRGEVLAIIRGGAFGYGLIAFPGGINDGERPIDCIMRELDEEVGIFKLNPWLTREMLMSWIVHEEVFDDPRRDARGQYVSSVFHFIIPDDVDRPVVRGDDDAKKAHFIAKTKIKAKKTFSDHCHIFRKFERIRSGEEAVSAQKLVA